VKKILIVSHDAGGANILSALAKKYRYHFNWVVYLKGPAKKIFLKNKVNSFAKIYSPRNFSTGPLFKKIAPDLVLTGTSWESSFENDFIKMAKMKKIATATFIDHWSDYRLRFGYPGKWRKNLPDTIFVGDQMAYKIALEKGFSKQKLMLVENPYFEETIQEANNLKLKSPKKRSLKTKRLLFTSGPISDFSLKQYDNSAYLGFSEYKILEDLLEIMRLFKKFTIKLKIRLHPSEDINKYSNLLRNQKYSKIRKFIAISNPAKNPLVKDCCWADAVIGSGSMALVIAHLLGKKAISYMPTDKKINLIKQKYSLPQKEIDKIYSRKALLEEIKRFKNKPWPKIKRSNNFFKKKLFAKAISNICP
jgi:hypothetical protein